MVTRDPSKMAEDKPRVKDTRPHRTALGEEPAGGGGATLRIDRGRPHDPGAPGWTRPECSAYGPARLQLGCNSVATRLPLYARTPSQWHVLHAGLDKARVRLRVVVAAYGPYRRQCHRACPPDPSRRSVPTFS